MRYFTLILLLFALPARSQTMQGRVTDANGRALVAVTVVNVNTQQTAYTDDHGYYSVPARPADVVAFTYVGYKPVEKSKPPSTIIATINVTMEATDYRLREVQVHGANLTQYQYDSIERRTIYRSELERKHPSPFISPVSAIAEKFSRKAKKTYRFQKSYADREQQRFIDTRYTPELVEASTRLSGDSIGYFMYAYPMPYDFARVATELEMKMWIRNNYKAWNKKTVARKDSL